MQIRLRDFRCFHEPSPVSIRPINLLVGENSAGKTSFLAAIRFLFELFGRKPQPSFNKEPFHLGAFDQIAHYRGGRFGRAKLFSFEIEDALPRQSRSDREADLFKGQLTDVDAPSRYSLKVSFKDFKTQPSIESIIFDAGKFGFSMRADAGAISIEIKTPSQPSYLYEDVAKFDDFEPLQIGGLIYLDFVLRDLRYLSPVEEGGAPGKRRSPREVDSNLISKQFLSEVEFLSEMYRSIRWAFPSEIYASAPVRSKPERTYNPGDASLTPDGGHIPFTLAQLHAFDTKKWSEIETAIAAFGKAAGLFDSLQIKQIGNNASGPFQIVVNLPGRKSNIIDVGYGVSQALPIVADLLRMDDTMFLFQQPEVHLHPRAQAELGTFFAAVQKQKGHTLFLETHSDYLLDRIRMEVRKGELLRPSDVSILYFARRGHDVEIYSMEIDKNGNILGAPDDYRTFFLREEARSLGIELP